MDAKDLILKTKLFLFDMDGTLYLGDRLYEFTPELLETIRQRGGRYLFMTNNSTKSVKDYVKKLERLGIAAQREDFITSSQATAKVNVCFKYFMFSFNIVTNIISHLYICY